MFSRYYVTDKMDKIDKIDKIDREEFSRHASEGSLRLRVGRSRRMHHAEVHDVVKGTATATRLTRGGAWDPSYGFEGLGDRAVKQTADREQR